MNSSIIDVKIGKLTYGKNAKESRIKKEKVKCEVTTSKTLGIRIMGNSFYKFF